MKELLRLLEERLKLFRASYFVELNPGLGKDKIDWLAEKFGIQIPADLKEFYEWKNGQADQCSESFVNNSMFIPLEHALETAQELTSMIGSDFEIENWWSSQWIPIFHNGMGDYICYDLSGMFTGDVGQLIEFWHADDDRNVVAPDLRTFLQALVQYFDVTPPDTHDKTFRVRKLIDGHPKRFKLN